MSPAIKNREDLLNSIWSSYIFFPLWFISADNSILNIINEYASCGLDSKDYHNHIDISFIYFAINYYYRIMESQILYTGFSIESISKKIEDFIEIKKFYNIVVKLKRIAFAKIRNDLLVPTSMLFTKEIATMNYRRLVCGLLYNRSITFMKMSTNGHILAVFNQNPHDFIDVNKMMKKKPNIENVKFSLDDLDRCYHYFITMPEHQYFVKNVCHRLADPRSAMSINMILTLKFCIELKN